MRTTMKKSILGLFVLLTLGYIGGGIAISGEGQYHNSLVKWNRIEGVIVPGNALTNLNVVGGVDSVGFSWTATFGKARVNLANGRVQFWVKGLVLASQSPTFGNLVIGAPSPGVTTVKGTIVCNAADPAPFNNVELIDTEAVPLSRQGDAKFKGRVDLPAICDDIAFLIRVADANVILDRWIAYGAVRSP